MDLQGENRIFVKAGLRALNKTQNLGLQELIRVQGIEAENDTVSHRLRSRPVHQRIGTA